MSGGQVVFGGTSNAGGGGGGTTTNPLTMNNSGAGAASGTNFDGSAAVTLSYNTIGAVPSGSASSLTPPVTITDTAGNADLILTNSTVATNSTTNASPELDLRANYWTGAASAADDWTVGSSLAAGTNGASTLTIAHTGSTGAASVLFPAGTFGTPSVAIGTNATGMLSAGGSLVAQLSSGGPGTFQFYTGATDVLDFQYNGSTGQTSFISRTGNIVFALVGSLTTLSGRAGVNLGNPALAGTAAGTQYCVAIGDLTANSAALCTFNPSSGTTNFVAIAVNPTINQTGSSSGNYTGLLVNAKETSLKGTANLLLDLQAGSSGGTSQFSVSNTGKVTKYGAVATVGAGVPSLVATIDLTTQGAAIAAGTALYAVPAAGAGLYRVVCYAKITQAATTSSVLGGTNGFQLTWTDPTDSANPTATFGDASSVSLSGNATTTIYVTSAVVACKASTNLQYGFDYTSVGVTPMQFKISIKVEYLG